MPQPQPEFVEATFYAVIQPEWDRYWKDDRDRPLLKGARLERTLQNRPAKVAGDAVVTRLTLRVDASALLPLQPQAVIHITTDDVEIIHVVADHPDEDES